MITVVGLPEWRVSEPAGPAGRACEVALAAASAGARVELVGRTGDDAMGDQLLLALSRASVGHAAVLRDPARPTPVRAASRSADEDRPFDEAPALDAPDLGVAPRLEAADVALGLRYLTGFDVLAVMDEAPGDVVRACLDAAAFAGARIVVLAGNDSDVPELPPDAIALGAPRTDDGAFGPMVGRLCAALDRGLEPAAALDAAVGDDGWEVVPGDGS